MTLWPSGAEKFWLAKPGEIPGEKQMEVTSYDF